MAISREDTVGDLLAARGRELDEGELSRLVMAIVEHDALWRPLVDHSDGERHYESLYADDHVGVWVISWMPGNDTGFHDHDGSRGAFGVAEGEIREERPLWARPRQRKDAVAGETVSFGETDLHRMVNVSDDPAVTVHAYSPPLTTMGAYSVDEDGTVHRECLDWDDKLEA